MSRFRKLVEDIINKGLLNVDDAIQANEFATEILRDFFRQYNTFIRQLILNANDSITLNINGIIINLVIDGTYYGAFNSRTKEITLHFIGPLGLLKIDLIEDRLRHELIHYYDDVIMKKALNKNYKNIDDIHKNPEAYTKSDIEVSAFYPGICAFVYRMILYYLKQASVNNWKKQSLEVYVKEALNSLQQIKANPLNIYIRYYNNKEKSILYNNIYKYISKVLPGV